MARVTVEDCIEKVPNRFKLVHVAAKRAKQLFRGAAPLVSDDNKAPILALREIAANLVEATAMDENSDEGSAYPPPRAA